MNEQQRRRQAERLLRQGKYEEAYRLLAGDDYERHLLIRRKASLEALAAALAESEAESEAGSHGQSRSEV